MRVKGEKAFCHCGSKGPQLWLSLGLGDIDGEAPLPAATLSDNL